LLGEEHQPEPHLIPLVLLTALGKRESFSILGTDYPTSDGTCIRDFIHVSDLADAHVLGLEYLLQGGDTEVFNLGNGNGFSIKQVIETAKEVTGREIKITEGDRRLGDPPMLFGSSDKARSVGSCVGKFIMLREFSANNPEEVSGNLKKVVKAAYYRRID
jgi:UDP-glucose 4-epimerase